MLPADPPIRGRVEVVTTTPLAAANLQPRGRIGELFADRPWLAPALLLGLVTVVVALSPAEES